MPMTLGPSWPRRATIRSWPICAIGFGFVELADANYANIEDLVALPTVGGADFRGNELNNLRIGGMSADTLTGSEGNDTLNGNADGIVDLLRGNDGNDAYSVDELIENIEELTGEGTDAVKTSLATLALAAGPTPGVWKPGLYRQFGLRRDRQQLR